MKQKKAEYGILGEGEPGTMNGMRKEWGEYESEEVKRARRMIMM